MSRNIKALIKKSGLLTLAYILALSSVNVILPYLFTGKAGALSRDIATLISPETVTTTYKEPIMITVTAEEAHDALSPDAPGASGQLGAIPGMITANIPTTSRGKIIT